MKLLKLLTVVVATLSFTLTQGFSAKPVNTECPVEGEPVEGKSVASYKVNFCCEECKAKFDEEPAKFLKKVAKADEGKCPISGKDVDTSVSSTVKVGTCCDDCKTKFEEDPKEFLSKKMK